MDTLLVTGASGHFGRAVLRHLVGTLKVPSGAVIAATRRPEALAGIVPAGVAVRRLDFDDPATFAEALGGIGRMLLISTDAVGHRTRQHADAIAAAVKAGVKHVAYTSMPEPEGSPALIAPDHLATERALAGSALPGWTVLRNNWYFENLTAALAQPLATGTWYSAAGDGRIAYIARDDLARAAAAALAARFDGKRTLTLTGGKAWTTEEIAALVSETTGRRLAVVHVPPDGLVEGIVAAGLPEAVARLIASLDENAAQGRLAAVTGDYRALTGADPQALPDWLAANRAAFAPAKAA